MMKGSGECIGRERCEELAKSSSFYRKVYSEVWLIIDLFLFFFLKLIALNEFFCIGLLDRGNWMGTAKEIRWRFNVFQLSDFVSSSIFRVSLQNLWLMDNVISTLHYMYLNIHVTW